MNPQELKQLVVGYYYQNLLGTFKGHMAQEICGDFQQVLQLQV